MEEGAVVVPCQRHEDATASELGHTPLERDFQYSK
jgi:hypothetical protein